jgi:hypothetical protein
MGATKPGPVPFGFVFVVAAVAMIRNGKPANGVFGPLSRIESF